MCLILIPKEESRELQEYISEFVKRILPELASEQLTNVQRP